MRHFFQRLFSLLLLCVAGVVVAEATVGTLQTLAAGSHTLKTGKIYLMSAADETGVTKEYTLTATGGLSMNVALRVHLGSGNNKIILKLKGYSTQTAALTDDKGNYVPPLKVLGNGTLIVRHEDTSQTVFLRIQDCYQGELPAIDLSEMLGGEVRFERAVGGEETAFLEISRVWKSSSTSAADLSIGTKPKPVIVANANVRLTFAGGMRARLQASPCAVRGESGSGSYVLPELISGGYASMRIEAGAVVRVRRYGASTSAVKNSWTARTLFPAAITLAGGCLELDNYSLPSYIGIPKEKMDEAVAAAQGCGEVFGKKILTVSAKSSVVPETCIKVAGERSLTETERTTDSNGRLVIDAAKSPELVYAPSETESEKSAVTLFDLVPTVTANGCTVDSCFGIAEFKVNKVVNSDFDSTLKVAVDLPAETAKRRSFYLRVLQTSPSGTVSTIYPATGTAALTTFTREAADSSRFSASIPCRITPSRGTTSITVRAYATPPTK